MIILFGGEKGGTGKTTLSTQIAVEFAQGGADVLLVDTDKQGSASAFIDARNENEVEPSVECVQLFGKNVGTQVAKFSERYDVIVIDAGGRDSHELRSAMIVADIHIIPVRPGKYDVQTLEKMDSLVGEVKILNDSLKGFALINCAPTTKGMPEAQLTKDFMEDLENIALMQTIVHQRVSFSRTALFGESVTEAKLRERDEKASNELESLFKEIRNA